MSDEKPTLRRVMANPLHGLSDTDRASAELQRKVARDVELTDSRVRLPSVHASAAEFLNLPLPDLLVAGWSKAQEILGALRESKDSPEEHRDVALAEHPFDCTLHPYLEMRISGIPQPKRIEFTVELACILKGVVLRIQNGCIIKIISGTGEFKGALKYKDFVLFETPEGAMPAIELGSGIELNPAPSQKALPGG